jgi:D-alanyl-lipoteichoic acid acyltransferase DltB (MBOAT superfamily)
MGDAWLGALAFTFQLYFDFSGYSDMAIGVARMFGIRLPLNFDSPYKAAGVIDFWRRWHMTLSRWLRDYVYIPLGGNRRGEARRWANLMITMLLGGLWHGAGWTFVFWGGLHGAYLGVNHAWRRLRPAAALETVPPAARRAASVGLTFLAVTVAWVFFRAPDFIAARRLLAAMFGARGFHLTSQFGDRDEAMLLAALFVIVWTLPNTQQIMERFRPGLGVCPRRPAGATSPLTVRWRPDPWWAAATALAGFWALSNLSYVREFIYYQF